MPSIVLNVLYNPLTPQPVQPGLSIQTWQKPKLTDWVYREKECVRWQVVESVHGYCRPSPAHSCHGCCCSRTQQSSYSYDTAGFLCSSPPILSAQHCQPPASAGAHQTLSGQLEGCLAAPSTAKSGVLTSCTCCDTQGLFDKPPHQRGSNQDAFAAAIQLVQGCQQFEGLCSAAQAVIARHARCLVLQESAELSG